MAQITLTQDVERQLKELVTSAFVSEDAFGVVDTIVAQETVIDGPLNAIFKGSASLLFHRVSTIEEHIGVAHRAALMVSDPMKFSCPGLGVAVRPM